MKLHEVINMSVCVEYTIRNATIKREFWAQAVEVVNDLFKGGRSFAWLEPGDRNHVNLSDAIEEWGFEVQDRPDFIEIVRFGWAKAGNEEKLLAALVPYLNPDAVFEVLDTGDKDHWRYVIRRGQLVFQKGHVIYQDHAESWRDLAISLLTPDRE